METHLHKVEVEPLSDSSLDWFVNIAAVQMLTHEVKRTELIHMGQLHRLAVMGKESGTAFISKIGNKYTGAIGGLLLPNVFNPDIKTLTEIFWYVLPEYRNTRSGLMLLNTFNKCGMECADEINMCLLMDSPVSTKSLEKRGFEMKEVSFRKGT